MYLRKAGTCIRVYGFCKRYTNDETEERDESYSCMVRGGTVAARFIGVVHGNSG